MTFSDVLVSGYKIGGQSEGPLDSFSFAYSRAVISYAPQGADGAPGKPVVRGWDIKTNKPV